MLTIDGSSNLGSGQTVRIAVSLAAILGKELHLYNIRQNRDNPGLTGHHKSVVETLAKLCDAKTEGVCVGSSELSFTPKRFPKSGEYELVIKTMGSAIIQAEPIILALSLTEGMSTLKINGGSSYPCEHFRYVVRWFLKRLGIQTEMETIKKSYPCVITINIFPSSSIRPLQILERGGLLHKFSVKDRASETIVLEYENTILGYDGTTLDRKLGDSIDTLHERYQAGRYADYTMDISAIEQLLPFLVFANGSCITVSHISEHLDTAVSIYRSLLGISIKIEKQFNSYKLSIGGFNRT
ncbi:MAG: RNA 3'-terminal phosphate cyclase [bacterium]